MIVVNKYKERYHIKKIISLLLASVMTLGGAVLSMAAEQMDAQDAAISKHMKLLESFQDTRGAIQYPEYYAGAYLSDSNELV